MNLVVNTSPISLTLSVIGQSTPRRTFARQIYRVSNDTGPDVTFEITGVDVTGYTFKMRVRKQDGSTFTRNGVITDAPNGRVKFLFVSGDLTEGDHEFEIEATTAGGQIVSYPDDEPIALIVRG